MTQIQLKIKLFRIVKDNITFIDKIQVLVKRKKKTENGRNEGKFFKRIQQQELKTGRNGH